MEEITFNDLPAAVEKILKRLDEIEKLVRELEPPAPVIGAEEYFNTIQAAEFLNLTIPTIYGLVHRRAIPVFKKGKQLRFTKQSLTDWIQSGRKESQAEIDLQAELHMLKLKKSRLGK